MLSQLMKEDLRWACKYALLEIQQENKAGLNVEELSAAKKYIKEDATYEQLMNLAFSPKPDLYLESEDLENIFASCLENFVGHNVSASNMIMESIMLEDTLAGDIWKGITTSPIQYIKNYNQAVTDSVKEKFRGATSNELKKIDGIVRKFAKDHNLVKKGRLTDANKKILAQKIQAAGIEKAHAAKVRSLITRHARRLDNAKSLEGSFDNFTAALVNKSKKAWDQADKATSSAANDAMKHIKDNKTWYIVGAAALAVIGTLIYKKYLSAAARTGCKKSDDVKECIKKAKTIAINKTIDELKSAKSSCSKDSNPEKCNAKIDKQIDRWKKKLDKVA